MPEAEVLDGYVEPFLLEVTQVLGHFERDRLDLLLAKERDACDRRRTGGMAPLRKHCQSDKTGGHAIE